MKKTGKRIKELRVGKNLSQRALAEKCGISHSNLSKIENGEGHANMETLFKLTTVLDASLLENNEAMSMYKEYISLKDIPTRRILEELLRREIEKLEEV